MLYSWINAGNTTELKLKQTLSYAIFGAETRERTTANDKLMDAYEEEGNPEASTEFHSTLE